MKAKDVVVNKSRKDMCCCCCQTVYMNMVCFSHA